MIQGLVERQTHGISFGGPNHDVRLQGNRLSSRQLPRRKRVVVDVCGNIGADKAEFIARYVLFEPVVEPIDVADDLFKGGRRVKTRLNLSHVAPQPLPCGHRLITDHQVVGLGPRLGLEPSDLLQAHTLPMRVLRLTQELLQGAQALLKEESQIGLIGQADSRGLAPDLRFGIELREPFDQPGGNRPVLSPVNRWKYSW